jgi:sialate O-acetylesterase
MVLQRDKPNRFWGWTEPGQKVVIEIEGKSASATASSDGKWNLTLDVPPAGGPDLVKISGPKNVTLHDILVGDVWLCGGQSNMGVSLNYSAGGEEAVRSANRAELRLCTVAARNAYTPAAVAVCDWKTCSPETAAGFSAVAYYFAQRLQQDIHVPIGLIQDCAGGSPAESWMSAPSLAQLGEFIPQLAEIKRLNARDGEKFGSFLMHWLDENDAGGKEGAWAQPTLDESGWKTVQLPGGGFASLGVSETPAVCWFRRTVTLLADFAGGPAKIILGQIEKMDTTYINGRWVGASSWVENPRTYSVPAGVLHPGANVIAVRAFKTKPQGGFQSDAGTLSLQLANGTVIPLAGSWLGQLSVDARPPFPMPLDLENYPTMPSVLGNGMIAPLAPLTLTGVLWYQGEANQTRPAQYRKLLPALIRDWREQFSQGEIPFYIVSLPAFMGRHTEPHSDGWTEVRDAQIQTAQNVPNAGVAVTFDTGEADNIHPKEKRIIGERLALLALASHYHQPVAASGPILGSVEKQAGSLRLHFDPAGGNLVVHGDKPGDFIISGADQTWHRVTAKIDGETIVVSAPEVPAPVAIRYAWQANPVATLFNTAGLPTAPFRTDDWPLDSAH